VEPRDIIETVSHGSMLMHFASTVGSSKDSERGSTGRDEDRSRSGSGENERPPGDEDMPTKQGS